MSFIETGGGLDTRCIVALQQSNDLFRFLKSIRGNIPAYVFLEGDKAQLQLYFNEDTTNPHDISFLEKYGAKKFDDLYIIKQKISNRDELGMINKLISEPMVASNAVYVSNGWLVVDLRFHSSKYQDISRILGSYMHKTDKIRLLYLGDSPGLSDILDELNQRVPLSMVVFEIPLGEANIPDSLLMGDIDLLETENSLLMDNRIKVILYRKGENGEFEAVAENRVENMLISEIRRRANEQMIIRYNMFVKRKGDFVRMLVIMPSNQINRYLRIVFSVAIDNQNLPVSLVSAAPYGANLAKSFA